MAPLKKIKSPIRWLSEGNIHLTVKFLGEISPSLCGQIEKRLLEPPLPIRPFTLVIRGLGKFAHGDVPSVIWAGIEANESLHALFRQIEQRLALLGLERDRRDFTPHITLGRNKSHADFAVLGETLAAKAATSIAECHVAHIHLVKSQLTSGGPIYTILKEIPLAPA